MGRHKIQIKQIDNPKIRLTTFNKRKTGLFKKAYELAELTNANVTLLVRSESGKNYMFQSVPEPLQLTFSYEYDQLTKDQIREYSDNAERAEVPEVQPKQQSPKQARVPEKENPPVLTQMHKKRLDIQIPLPTTLPIIQDFNNQMLSPCAVNDITQQRDIMSDNNMQQPMYFMINTPNQGPVVVSTPSGVACQMIFPKQ